jgi:hypothetical protein
MRTIAIQLDSLSYLIWFSAVAIGDDLNDFHPIMLEDGVRSLPSGCAL